jgi:heptosyltransferase-2
MLQKYEVKVQTPPGMKILIIQQKMIGDVLASSVLCSQLKKNIPDAEVHYSIHEHTLPVIQDNPFIDKIVLFTKAHRKNKRDFYFFLKSLSAEKYDVVIDVYGKIESNLITLFSSARTRISYEKWYSKFIYTHTFVNSRIRKTAMGLAIENRLKLLIPLIDNSLQDVDPPKIYLNKKEIAIAKNFLAEHNVDTKEPLIMIAPLGSSENKSYPLPYMAKVLDYIAEKTNATLLLNHIPTQSEKINALIKYCGFQATQKIKLGTYVPSLREFLALLHQCDALVGNEGGAVNMAKALSVPTFSIHSPWVGKAAWDTFSGNSSNIAVHLEDFMPEKFAGKSKKILIKETPELYNLFSPDLFLDQIDTFLRVETIADQ